QRGMDHLGAVVGPLLATLFLVFYPGQYRTLFLWTIVPGAVAVALILLLPAEDQPARTPTEAIPAAEGADTRTRAAARDVPLPRRFHFFVAVLALFMLGNSSDAFLLLRLTDAAGSARFVPLMWRRHLAVEPRSACTRRCRGSARWRRAYCSARSGRRTARPPRSRSAPSWPSSPPCCCSSSCRAIRAM